jgi:hypothetical protein
MGEYSEDEAREAKELVDHFLHSEARAVDDRLGVVGDDWELVVSDVEADAREFTLQLEFLERIGEPAPAVVLGDGELAPTSLPFRESVVAGPWGRWWRDHPLALDLAYESVRRARLESHELTWVEPSEARSTFLRRATDFLATRIATVRAFRRGDRGWSGLSMLTIPPRVGAPTVTTPGCAFVVSTNSSGLRVFWSGAYFVAPKYFGHPTSPTSAPLQSGRYLFGVDGGAYGSNVQWDYNALVKLPGSPSVHLNY